MCICPHIPREVPCYDQKKLNTQNERHKDQFLLFIMLNVCLLNVFLYSVSNFVSNAQKYDDDDKKIFRFYEMYFLNVKISIF